MSPALAGRVLTKPPGKYGASAVYPGDRIAGWELRPTADAQQPGRAADCMSLVQEEIKFKARFLLNIHCLCTISKPKSLKSRIVRGQGPFAQNYRPRHIFGI